MTTNKRLIVSGFIGLAAMAIIVVLDRTAYASWTTTITSVLVALAAIVLVNRNLRDGQYRLR
jgi:hypothetical protein